VNVNKGLEVQVVGGLGNQLFGFAAGLVLARTLTLHPVVNLERVGFGSNLTRKPDLQNIDLGSLAEGITFANSRNSSSMYLYEKVRRASRNLLPSLVNPSEPEYIDSLDDPRSQMGKIPRSTKSIGGPFMDFAWVEIAKDFGFPTRLSPKKSTKTFLNACTISANANLAIHIRLGDYLNHPNIFPIVPENYYLEALEYLEYRNQEVHVFTDSPRIAREKFPKLLQMSGVKILDPKRELSALETMSIMSRYPNLIASNSTFSSWAGWFNSDKKVITPVPHHYNDWSDTLPNHWTKIAIN
jgi:hypothetical protein